MLCGFARDPSHGPGKMIEAHERLGLGGLDHQSLVNDEWEIDSWRMNPKVQKSLCDIESLDHRQRNTGGLPIFVP